MKAGRDSIMSMTHMMNNSLLTEQPLQENAGRHSVLGGTVKDFGMEEMTTFSTIHPVRGASVPARFKERMGNKANQDFDPEMGKPMVWKRKRGSIKDNDFDLGAIAEKGVDKFRSGVKSNIERVATDKFLIKLKEEFGEKAGNKVNSVNDMVRDYSSFTIEKSE